MCHFDYLYPWVLWNFFIHYFKLIIRVWPCAGTFIATSSLKSMQFLVLKYSDAKKTLSILVHKIWRLTWFSNNQMEQMVNKLEVCTKTTQPHNISQSDLYSMRRDHGKMYRLRQFRTYALEYMIFKDINLPKTYSKVLKPTIYLKTQWGCVKIMTSFHKIMPKTLIFLR